VIYVCVIVNLLAPCKSLASISGKYLVQGSANTDTEAVAMLYNYTEGLERSGCRVTFDKKYVGLIREECRRGF
jgi:hypothetical protein